MRSAIAGFAVGGTIGGVLLLVPFLLADAGVRPGGYAGLLTVATSSIAAFVIPGAIGGAWVGRAIEDRNG